MQMENKISQSKVKYNNIAPNIMWEHWKYTIYNKGEVFNYVLNIKNFLAGHKTLFPMRNRNFGY